jgi:hypothetical protein
MFSLILLLVLRPTRADTDDYVHRWTLAVDGTDTGTGVNLVDIIPERDTTFLASGGAVLNEGSLGIGSSTFAFAATNGFTWCAWVRADGQATTATLFHLADGGGQNRIWADITFGEPDTILRLYIYNADDDLRAVWESETSNFFSGDAVGSWLHIAVTVTADGAAKLWRGGDQFPATQLTDDLYSSQTAIPVANQIIEYYADIGSEFGYKQWFYGGFRDVRLYNRALSSTEVAGVVTDLVIHCNRGQYGPKNDNYTPSACIECPAGKFGEGPPWYETKDTVCTGTCSPGSFCPAGSTSTTATDCPKGYTCSNDEWIEEVCPIGEYNPTLNSTCQVCNGVGARNCPPGSIANNPCPAGSKCVGNGEAVPCGTATYSAEGSDACTPWCPAGETYTHENGVCSTSAVGNTCTDGDAQCMTPQQAALQLTRNDNGGCESWV